MKEKVTGLCSLKVLFELSWFKVDELITTIAT